MTITGVELRLLELGLAQPFGAAHGEVSGHRPVVVVRVETTSGEGWGECEALPAAGYTSEWAAGAFEVLRDRLAPSLLGAGSTPEAVVAALAPDSGTHPMAVAALEQAVLDARLRAEGRSLAAWLGVGGDAPAVAAGAVVGLAPDADVLVARVGALVAAGYRRVKVKVQPGWDVVPLGAVRATFASLELQADANGSYAGCDPADLAPFDRFGLTCLEQPLGPDDLAGSARLRRRLATPVALDEGAASPDLVERVLAAGAADVVVIKPARLGGLVATRLVHDRCVDAGVPMLAGGLLEAGLGRRALVAVAALPGFTVTGDCSPADRWLVGDPWPAMDLVDGRVPVHTGPGVAPEPDPDRLDQATIARAELRPTR